MSSCGKGSHVSTSRRVRAGVQDANPQDCVSWLEGLVQPPPTAPWKAAEPRPRAMELPLPCMERIKGVSSTAGKVLAFHGRETVAGTEGEISRALRSNLCFRESLQTPTKTPADHQAKSSQHPAAAFAFTKPLLAASPIIFSLFCTDVMLRDYAVD